MPRAARRVELIETYCFIVLSSVVSLVVILALQDSFAIYMSRLFVRVRKSKAVRPTVSPSVRLTLVRLLSEYERTWNEMVA